MVIGANTDTQKGNAPSAEIILTHLLRRRVWVERHRYQSGKRLPVLIPLRKLPSPNWVRQVWDVGGLAGSITIPLDGSTNPNQYAVLRTYLLNRMPPSVPGGGTTAVMLGLPLCGLSVVSGLFGPKALHG
jgi:hypothetical protein